MSDGEERDTREERENRERSRVPEARDRTDELQDEPLGFSSPEPSEPPPPAPEPEHVEPPAPPVVEVEALDWTTVRQEVERAIVRTADRTRMAATLDRLELLLDDERGPGMAFDRDRSDADDRAILVRELDATTPVWFVGDLHGDLLALEAALALVRAAHDAEDSQESDTPAPRIVFLGDLFDDGGYGLEVLLRVFELVVEAPERMCVVVGNHDEALQWDGARFTATVSPSDFSDFLQANVGDPAVRRAGELAVRLFAQAPRALFFPDGLLVSHGGIPLVDLHDGLRASGDWNDPRALQDFVWTRAHARARRKLPNRTTRGSQFGYEDFAAFCALATELGRPVWRIVRGHDHEEERWAMPRAWAAHPLLTLNALSRRLPREAFGPDARVPAVARWTPGALPQVHRLHVPPELVRDLFRADFEAAAAPDTGGTRGGAE